MKTLLELLKLRITVAATTTTAVGYVMARGEWDLLLLPLLSGIFLQACGSAALNHVQEASLDALSARTAKRPIPSGRISRSHAAVMASALLAVGTAMLLAVHPLTAALGLAAAVIYNGIYTPLKRVTPFAAFPGSLIGCIPPVGGWITGGGHLADPVIHQVAFFFFIWQMPHFWLILLFHESSYRSTGLPSLIDRIGRQPLTRLTFTWIAAVATASLLMPLFRSLSNPLPGLLLAAAALALVLRASRLLRASGARSPPAAEDGGSAASYRRSYRLCFVEINAFALLVMVTLVVDRLV